MEKTNPLANRNPRQRLEVTPREETWEHFVVRKHTGFDGYYKCIDNREIMKEVIKNNREWGNLDFHNLSKHYQVIEDICELMLQKVIFEELIWHLPYKIGFIFVKKSMKPFWALNMGQTYRNWYNHECLEDTDAYVKYYMRGFCKLKFRYHCRNPKARFYTLLPLKHKRQILKDNIDFIHGYI